MHPYATALIDFYQQHANAEQAPAMEKYLRHQFKFFGLKHPDRRMLDAVFLEKHGYPPFADLLPISESIFKQAYREPHYFAGELFFKMKKHWDEDSIKLIEFLITHQSWWDTVDFLAARVSGEFFKLFPETEKQITNQWNHQENIWLQRSSLLYQLHYKSSTNTALLSAYIQNLVSSKEFFIQKAIGWILREYSKTNPGWVIDFIQDQQLSPLSKREGLKWLKNQSKIT